MQVVAFIQSTLLACGVGMLTYIYSQPIASFYTLDPDTLAPLKNCFMSLSVSICLLGPLLSLQGALKALQKQEVASRILLKSLYGVSLPLSYLLSCTFEIGMTGLWTGFAIG